MSSEDKAVGGQAVIEGVMMRAPGAISTAVRKVQSKEIVVKTEPYVGLSRRYKVLNVPVLRGAVSFFEMLVIGMKTLHYSADVTMEDADTKEVPTVQKKRGRRERMMGTLILAGTMASALSVGIGVFFLLPLVLTNLLHVYRGQLSFNLIAGAIRAGLFLFYLWIISRWGEIRRIFAYHGAEHKSVFAYESNDELSLERVRRYSTRHPRCGTSFILIVVVLAIVVFSIADSLFVTVFGHAQTVWERFLTHFSFLPLVAGLSFELLKLSGKKRNHPLTRMLIAPGLWLQRITTQEPDDEQIEVALVALKSALAWSESAEERRSRGSIGSKE